MSEYVQVTTTTDTRGKAEEIADALISGRLAACVQVAGPISSTYRWKNEVEHTREWLCFIKTRRDLFTEVEKAIRRLHNYTVPEILATPVTAGSADYLRWMEEETVPRPTEV